MKTKFEKIKAALEGKTYNTFNALTLRKGQANASQTGKYYTQNIYTNNTQKSYKTLNEIIKEFKLKIN